MVVAQATSLEIYGITSAGCNEVGRVELPSELNSVKFMHIFLGDTSSSTTWNIAVIGTKNSQLYSGTLDLISEPESFGPLDLPFMLMLLV